MRDTRHPRSPGVDSVCGKRPEQANPQGHRGGQWWSGAEGGNGGGCSRGQVSLCGEENVPEPDRGSGLLTIVKEQNAAESNPLNSEFHGA